MAKKSQMFVQLCLIVLVVKLAHVQCRSVPNYEEFSYDSHSVKGTFDVADPDSAPAFPDETFPEEKFYQLNPETYPDHDSVKDFTPEFNITGDSDLENSGSKYVDSNTIPAPQRFSGRSYEYDASSASKTLPDEFDIPFN